MDHKAFLQNMAPDMKVALTQRSDGPASARLAFHLGTILAMGLWIGLGLPLWWVLIPLLGIMLAFLFAIEHEATHRTLLSNQSLNDWIGRLCGVVLLLPFEWFRWFHMAHHRHTNDKDHDPELAGGPRPSTKAAWAWHVSGIPYWIAEARVTWRLAMDEVSDHFIPSTARARVKREAQAMLVVYAAALASLFVTPLLFWIWFLPVAFGQMALRVFLLSEHVDCPHVSNMFENTRTTFTTRLMRLITWNASYHVEHHIYPAVPFYSLPKLHDAIRQELKMTADGYARFTKEFLQRH